MDSQSVFVYKQFQFTTSYRIVIDRTHDIKLSYLVDRRGTVAGERAENHPLFIGGEEGEQKGRKEEGPA